MFETITVLTTNVCGLGCGYCNFYNRPLKEATLEEKLAMLDVFKSWPDYDKRFICLLGGDIIWMKGIREFTERMNELGLTYAFQTSAGNAKKMEEMLPIIKNLSISVDPVPGNDMFRWKKAVCGMYWAGRIKQLYPDIDVHATVTVDKNNVMFIPDLAAMLSDMGIWLEVTFVHWKKSDAYDLVPPKQFVGGFEEEDLPNLEKVVDKLIDMKRKGYKIHSTEGYLRDVPKYQKDLDWRCKWPVNAMIDADMSMRLCLHIKGNRVTKWKITDLYGTDRWEEFLKDWEADKKEMCLGCAWDCQSELQLESMDEVDAWISHKR